MRRAALHCPGENEFGATKGIKNVKKTTELDEADI